MGFSSRVHTKYTGLTNAELLAKIDDIRHRSPIIQELCIRIEEGELISDETSDRVECPICQGQLRVNYDPGNDLFSLIIQKD